MRLTLLVPLIYVCITCGVLGGFFMMQQFVSGLYMYTFFDNRLNGGTLPDATKIQGIVTSININQKILRVDTVNSFDRTKLVSLEASYRDGIFFKTNYPGFATSFDTLKPGDVVVVILKRGVGPLHINAARPASLL